MYILIPALIMAGLGIAHALGGDQSGASLLRTITPESTRSEKYKIFSAELGICFVAGLAATLIWAVGGLLWSGLLVAFHRTPDLAAIMLVISFYFLGYIVASGVSAIQEVRVHGKKIS